MKFNMRFEDAQTGEVTKLYTLEEAERELGRRECLKRGHRFEIPAEDLPMQLICTQCKSSWRLEPATP